jgi:hypothetical protein
LTAGPPRIDHLRVGPSRVRVLPLDERRLAAFARRLVLVLVLPLAACSSDDGAGPASGSVDCPAGQVADAAGSCVPLVCGEGERLDLGGGPACKALGWQACPAGFVADPSGHGCRDVLPATACGPGTMPVLGQTSCQAVGPASCAAGFERDPSGWGCRAIVASAACGGATRAALGSTACAPVGDCSAPFPPALATVFVDASFTNGQLDAAHVRTLAEGLAAAPANAVIAVAAGTYTETIAPSRSVRVVGRCAAMVTLASPGADAPGVSASGGVDVIVEGMTLTGHLRAASATTKASVTLRDVVMDANRGGGVSAKGAGTRVILERSLVRGSVAVPGGLGIGIETSGGADLAVRESAVADNVDTGILVAGAGTHVDIARTVVLSTRSNAAGDFGLGVMIRDGAAGEVSSSFVGQAREAGLAVYGKGTRVSASDVVVEGTRDSRGSSYGYGFLVDGGAAEVERLTVTNSRDAGIQVEAGGVLTARQSVVRDTVTAVDVSSGFGLALGSGGSASIEASAFVANEAVGVAAVGPKVKVKLDGSFVGGTKPDELEQRGYGLVTELGATAEVVGSALVGNAEAGVSVVDPGSRVALERTVIAATKAGKGKNFGRGMVVEKGATASVVQSALVGNRDIGLSARGAGVEATLRQTVIRGTLPRALDGVHGRGIEANDGARLTVAECAFLENHAVAVVGTSGSVVDVRDSWIADTLADGSPGAPGRAATVQTAATMSMLGVVAERNMQIAMVAADRASLTVRSSLVENTTAAEDGTFGHGLLAYDDALLVVDDVTIASSAGAALVFAASRGTVNDSRVRGNAVGIHAQGGSSFQVVAQVSEEPAANAVEVSSTTIFDGNQTRVGSGALPLPAPLQ